MNLVSRRLILSAVLVFFLAAAGAVASAAPTVTWAADPRTGCQIGYVNAYWSLAAATWTGPAVNGKAEGKGQISLTIRSKDGKEQLTISGEAETVAGLMDGKVLLKWTDGDSYDGYYKAGLRDGKGIYRGQNPDSTYTGDWKAGLREGKGLIEFTVRGGAHGSYEGDFKGDHYDGVGVYKSPSGNVYEGEFKNGNYHGKGKIVAKKAWRYL